MPLCLDSQEVGATDGRPFVLLRGVRAAAFSEIEREDLLASFGSLTDEPLLTDLRFCRSMVSDEDRERGRQHDAVVAAGSSTP